MVKVQIGNAVFECSSPAEAVEVFRLTQRGDAAGQAASAEASHEMLSIVPRIQRRLDSGAVSPSIAEHGSTGANGFHHEVLDKLAPHMGREFTSAQIMDIIGVKTANGVGPKFAGLRDELQNRNPPVDLDRYVRSQNAPDGSKRWIVQRW